jgi:Clp amino terminal domain, pathogenicity island component
MLFSVFERFTEQARQVVVLAQEYARELKHNYIGTEHLLLALLADVDDIPAQALGSFGVDQEAVRIRVVEIVGPVEEPHGGRLPFTPRGKKALEMALREALSLGHDDIRTGHLLLGLLRTQEGVAERVLLDLNVPSDHLRDLVIERLGPPGRSGRSPLSRETLEPPAAAAAGSRKRVLGPLCPSCRRPLSETLRLETIEAVREGQRASPRVEVTFCGECGTTISALPSPRPHEPPRVPEPADPESVEGRFQLRCRELIEQIQTAGFTPGGWIALIMRHGAVGAARELLSTGRILPVTRWLLEQGRPELTMEREIGSEEWATIFDDAERAEAERRLQQAAG